MNTEMKPHIVDCDVAPFTFTDWRVRAEDQLPGAIRGQFVWDPTSVRAHRSPNQERGLGYGAEKRPRFIVGDKLIHELANERVLPANILDYLLAHPELIPENWKPKKYNKSFRFFFWGTIYHAIGCGPQVRYLFWNGFEWTSLSESLDIEFGEYDLALLAR